MFACPYWMRCITAPSRLWWILRGVARSYWGDPYRVCSLFLCFVSFTQYNSQWEMCRENDEPRTKIAENKWSDCMTKSNLAVKRGKHLYFIGLDCLCSGCITYKEAPRLPTRVISKFRSNYDWLTELRCLWVSCYGVSLVSRACNNMFVWHLWIST